MLVTCSMVWQFFTDGALAGVTRHYFSVLNFIVSDVAILRTIDWCVHARSLARWCHDLVLVLCWGHIWTLDVVWARHLLLVVVLDVLHRFVVLLVLSGSHALLDVIVPTVVIYLSLILRFISD